METPEKTSTPAPQLAAQVIRENLNNLQDLPGLEVFASLPPEQQEASKALMLALANNMERSHLPILHSNGSIEMQLMKGGIIVIQEATGFNVMSAAREMAAANEKVKEVTQAVYTMVACADIDGEPMAMSDVNDRLTARDLMVLLDAFQTINLL